MKLVQDQKYRATISLGFFKRMASNAQVAEKLQEAGFKYVTVTGSGGTRYAEGVWGGTTCDADIPEEVSNVSLIS